MCLICGCEEPGRPRREIAVRSPGHPDPDELVLQAAEDALAVAEGWIGWSAGASMSLGNAWTPHKALRRITDHLVDHLCQVEARSADWARFTEQDLDEASARIRRLAQVLAIRLLALRPSWDEEAGEEWTIRAIAEHVAEASATYAGQPRSPASPARDGAQR